jgi:hypothetical protein
MLRALRRNTFAPLFALALFVATVPLSVFALAHDLADDDGLCGPVLVAHDAAAHRFDLPKDSAPPQHCFICHWLTSLHTVEPAAGGQPVPPLDSSQAAALPLHLSSTVIAGSLSARAPPLA